MNESEDFRSPKQHGARHSWSFLDSIQYPDQAFMSDATTNESGRDWHPPVFAPPASLLNSRRPSFTPSLPELAVDRSRTLARRSSRTDMAEPQPAGSSPTSPEDGGNFRRSLQIDMKGLVGDAVGNVSSIVLAATCFVSS
jgi:hypothetical protein